MRPRRPASDGRPPRVAVLAGLTLLLLLAAAVSLQTGASGISALAVLGGDAISARDRIILWDIRLPRLALGALVGAALAVSGAIMQGLFRNPLADPGIVGISAGAGLGAVLAILLGGALPAVLRAAAPGRRWCRWPPSPAAGSPPPCSTGWRPGAGRPRSRRCSSPASASRRWPGR